MTSLNQIDLAGQPSGQTLRLPAPARPVSCETARSTQFSLFLPLSSRSEPFPARRLLSHTVKEPRLPRGLKSRSGGLHRDRLSSRSRRPPSWRRRDATQAPPPGSTNFRKIFRTMSPPSVEVVERETDRSRTFFRAAGERRRPTRRIGGILTGESGDPGPRGVAGMRKVGKAGRRRIPWGDCAESHFS